MHDLVPQLAGISQPSSSHLVQQLISIIFSVLDNQLPELHKIILDPITGQDVGLGSVMVKHLENLGEHVGIFGLV
jgi:hypothetical protein